MSAGKNYEIEPRRSELMKAAISGDRKALEDALSAVRHKLCTADIDQSFACNG